VGLPLPMTAPSNLTADITLNPVPGAPSSVVQPVVRISRPEAVQSADWFDVTTWQGRRHGDGGLVIAPLHMAATDEGVVYTTDRPIPVSGTWKALIRLHKGRQLGVVPVFLPDDPAIPAPGFGPTQHYVGTFVADKKVLQREAVGGSVDLQRAAYALLLALGAVWIGSLAWGLRRLGGTRSGRKSTMPTTRQESEVSAAKGS
jgi:hypothetical protein